MDADISELIENIKTQIDTKNTDYDIFINYIIRNFEKYRDIITDLRNTIDDTKKLIKDEIRDNDEDEPKNNTDCEELKNEYRNNLQTILDLLKDKTSSEKDNDNYENVHQEFVDFLQRYKFKKNPNVSGPFEDRDFNKKENITTDNDENNLDGQGEQEDEVEEEQEGGKRRKRQRRVRKSKKNKKSYRRRKTKRG
jgi:gas vesicle protein